MAAEVPEATAALQVSFGMGHQSHQHLRCLHGPGCLPEDQGIDARPPQGMGIGRSAHHHAITVVESVQTLFGGVKTAIQFDQQLGSALLEGDHSIVLKRRDGAVLFGIQSFQPRFSGVHTEPRRSCRCHLIHKVGQQAVAVEIINPHPVFHRDRQVAGGHHRFHAAGHPIRFGHQAGAEVAGLYPRARATHIEVDFVVAPVRCHAGGFCQ